MWIFFSHFELILLFLSGNAGTGKEIEEIEVLQSYLPKPLSENEIMDIVQQAISALGASSVKDMGTIMAKIKDKLHGRADMGKVSAIVKSELS